MHYGTGDAVVLNNFIRFCSKLIFWFVYLMGAFMMPTEKNILTVVRFSYDIVDTGWGEKTIWIYLNPSKILKEPQCLNKQINK